MNVKEIGSFFIGGKTVKLEGLPVYETAVVAGGPKRTIDPNGEFTTGQMYVQYVKLEQSTKPYPVLLWHGGGCTGTSWETTPDGRQGWQMEFLRKGYDVYTSDAVERGRASWSKFPEIYTSEPVFRNKKDSWEFFRIGENFASDANQRKPFDASQFPVEFFDDFCKQIVPRWTSNQDATNEAYQQYVDKVGPCVIVAHSQASEFLSETVLKMPEKIKAIVLLEATSSAEPTLENLAKIKNIPYLYVWGDNLSSNPLWQKYQKNTYDYYLAQKNYGCDVTWLDLPALNITGNGHFFMLEKNSNEIFSLVTNWLEEKL